MLTPAPIKSLTPHGLVYPATMADAKELAETLREEDRREIVDISGQTPLHNFQLAVLIAKPCLVMRTHEGELVGIVGVVPVGLNRGAIAMSGTRLIEQIPKAFLRGSRDVLAYLERHYETLFNVCDARNHVHLKWLKWLGFSLIRRQDNYGVGKIEVIEFAKISTTATKR